MNGPGDMELLRMWISHRDREALGQLIRRHINFVYATARRQVGDAHLAEDVTQAVFILLLQKAHRIKSEAAMTSWLFTTTRYAAANAMKMLRRRRYYEQAAAAMARNEEVSDDSDELTPLLDDAIAHLPRLDRTCVTLSFLQQKSHGEVAAATGISEEAARKRVSRAVEKMRAFFASRGIVAGSVAIGAVMMHQSPASAGLAESTLNVAVLSQSASQVGLASTIAKGVSNMLFTMKSKLAAAAGVALLVSGLATGQVIKHLIVPISIPVAALQQAPAEPSDAVTMEGNIKVQFAGVAPVGSGTSGWHSIFGKPIDWPLKDKPSRFVMNPPPAYQVLVRFWGPDDADVSVRLSKIGSFGSMQNSQPSGERDYQLAFQPSPDVISQDIEVLIADGPWKKAVIAKPTSQVGAYDTDKSGLTITPLFERDGRAVVYVSMGDMNDLWRLIANDVTGQSYLGKPGGGAGSEHVTTREFSFDVPAALITSLEIQTRPYNKKVTAHNITLDPTKASKPEIVVRP